ncbi:MAG: FtsX-like permease family protein [Chitinophagaceae bacterium]|nr:FtsX-like permease family protein [Chitinophagaceae bacterium]
MIKNYFKIAIRQLLKHKLYSLINLGGLTAALTTCFLIFLWAADEFSTDKFHTHINRIYKVMINDFYPDGKIDTYDAPTVKIGDALRKDIPEIEGVIQTSRNTDILLKYNGKSFTENGLYADSAFFSMFSFPVISGNMNNPLPNANAISISQKLARKLFNTEDPVGKILEVNKIYNMTVASVFKDIPQNSSIQFDYIISFELWKKENPWAQHWRSGATQAFVMLNSRSDFHGADAKVRRIIRNNCNDCNREAFLYPFSRAYLNGKFENGKPAGGKTGQLSLFGMIAIVVLIMACINFINLTTARATTRFREIGVRKVTGASDKSLRLQFIGESVLMAFIAMLFSVFLAILLVPVVNEITGKSMGLNFNHPVIAAGILGITLLSGLMAGLYPALYLSSKKAIAIFKNNAQSAVKTFSFRKVLVVAQFTISLVLLIGSIFIYRQLSYIFKKDLGFKKENIIVLNHREEFNKNYSALKNELLRVPSVKSAAFAGSNLFQVPITTTDPVWPNKPANSSISFKVLRCDEDFIPAMHIKLQSGRNFSGSNNADSSNYIINEKAMHAMGLTRENVIGTKLEMWNGKGEVIGLTADFINGNLHQATQPLILMFSKTNGLYHLIETAENSNMAQTLGRIESIVRKYAPDYPFEYSFLDNIYNQEYKDESAQGKLFLGFTIVSLIICCLGLFGLSTFAAERKVKEIGVRKVLGASISSIVGMISKDFLILVIISILIAVPLAYYFVVKWLEDFAHHTPISWWVFILAAFLAIAIAILTIGFQAVKAAIANPVGALRSE